jgi:hypothetical protein
LLAASSLRRRRSTPAAGCWLHEYNEQAVRFDGGHHGLEAKALFVH